jgi:hypothetical protein
MQLRCQDRPQRAVAVTPIKRLLVLDGRGVAGRARLWCTGHGAARRLALFLSKEGMPTRPVRRPSLKAVHPRPRCRNPAREEREGAGGLTPDDGLDPQGVGPGIRAWGARTRSTPRTSLRAASPLPHRTRQPHPRAMILKMLGGTDRETGELVLNQTIVRWRCVSGKDRVHRAWCSSTSLTDWNSQSTRGF